MFLVIDLYHRLGKCSVTYFHTLHMWNKRRSVLQNLPWRLHVSVFPELSAVNLPIEALGMQSKQDTSLKTLLWWRLQMRNCKAPLFHIACVIAIAWLVKMFGHRKQMISYIVLGLVRIFQSSVSATTDAARSSSAHLPPFRWALPEFRRSYFFAFWFVHISAIVLKTTENRYIQWPERIVDRSNFKRVLTFRWALSEFLCS